MPTYHLNPDTYENVSVIGTADFHVDVFLEPVFLTNSQTVSNPAFVEIYTVNVSLHENSSVISDPDGFDVVQYPSLLTNTHQFPIMKIGLPTVVLEPTTIVNSSVIYVQTEELTLRPAFVLNSSTPYNLSTVRNTQIFVDFFDNEEIFRKPLVRIHPFVAPIEIPDIIVRPVSNLPVSERSTTDLLRTFKDLSLMFRPHPLTGDVTRVFDYDSVTQALKVIIYTEFFERPFSSQLKAGSIRSKLFEINDPISRREIQEHIASAILKCEPRVLIQEIKVVSAGNPNAVNVSITYKIRTFQRSETFSLFLERV